MTQTKVIGLSDAIPPYDTEIVAGIDEAGRGALAGPVVAATVIFAKGQAIAGCADSKTLSAKRRYALADKIQQHALAWGIAFGGIEEIAAHNILQATLKAMAQSFRNCKRSADLILVDGNVLPPIEGNCHAVIQGDARVAVISAASILAKVARDKMMVELHEQYPSYGFDRHKGYGTKQHREALQQFGTCDIHRTSWAGVQSILV